MIQACIISVGNELLNGHTADTNACWLSGKLFERGIMTAGIWAVPDEQQRIITAMQQAAEQGHLLLVTGGLGPTDDDVTRHAVAGFLGVELELRPEILAALDQFFSKRGKIATPNNRVQAYVPACSEILENPLGTAPGFWCDKEDIAVAVMPGVPSEMKRMFEDRVMPRLEALTRDSVVVSGKLRCYGLGESDLCHRLGDLMHRQRNPLINCTCGSGDVVLHIIARAESKQAAQKMVQNDKLTIRNRVGRWIYGEDDQTLAVLIGDILRRRGITLATAESCTGGLLSGIITDVPGASDYFKQGWITYSNTAKTDCLGVPAALIDEVGAVSEQVAAAMARGAAQKAGADIGVGITGIAGPGGGTEQKPIGLVYIGTCVEGRCDVKEYRFPVKDRHTIRLYAVAAALNDIRLRMQV